MDETILVTYATRLGSSRETAAFIADVLRENGLHVDLQPMVQVHAPGNYRAVVLVAALYTARLHKDARAFLAKHRAALEQRPVALFVPGPVDREEKSWAGARAQLKARLDAYPWLHPFASHVIGGKWDPANMPWPWRFLLKKVPPSDARDWDAIRGMVRDLANALQPANAKQGGARVEISIGT